MLEDERHFDGCHEVGIYFQAEYCRAGGLTRLDKAEVELDEKDVGSQVGTTLFSQYTFPQ